LAIKELGGLFVRLKIKWPINGQGWDSPSISQKKNSAIRKNLILELGEFQSRNVSRDKAKCFRETTEGDGMAKWLAHLTATMEDPDLIPTQTWIKM
jgi:hypothetical protein